MNLQIPVALREEMLVHLTNCLPEEGCGLLGGQGSVCSRVIPISNELHSPTGFRMDPQEQLRAFLQFEDQGLELTAIYHSHPHGPQIPSATDVAEFAYPGVISMICVPLVTHWMVRGFIIDGETVTEITLIWE
jgi:proteasome lid subunit RPN8/RPN11